MNKKVISLSAFALSQIFCGQVGINTNTPNPSAVLELSSSTKGFLPPRVALTSPTSSSPLSAHVIGMIVYNTTSNGDVEPGLYINNGSRWSLLSNNTATSTTTANLGGCTNLTSYYTLGTSTAAPASGTANSITFTRQGTVISYGTHKYWVYTSPSNTTWNNGLAFAVSIGGYLFVPTTKAEHETVIDAAFTRVSPNTTTAIGWKRTGVEGTRSPFYPITCENVEFNTANTALLEYYTTWMSSTIDGSGQCGRIFNATTYLIDDIPCTGNSLNTFIIEFNN